MPPKKLKESIIFLVNIGVIRYGTQNNSCLLDKSKFIVKHIIQKKIFLRPKDEIGVILMGSDAEELDNIQELCSMQIGNWDLIESIDNLKTTNQTCSWIEAIYAAVEYIKRECVDHSLRKIILLSDFNEEEDIVSQFQADNIVETLRSEEISLIAIGERALYNIDEDSYTASEKLLMAVQREICGQYFTFEHIMSDVRFYRRPSTRPSPWHCDMEFGDFRIPIIGISKVPNEPKLPDMSLIAKTSTSDMADQQVPIKSVAQYADNTKTVHTKEQIIRGYMYGGQPISVSEETQKNMTPKTNEKCYKIHGFTARKNIPMEYWLSDGTYVIVPADESVSAPFYSLVQAMVEEDVVAIVEKVYRKNSEANMMALFPSVDDPNEPWCLIEIGLPFERDYGAIAYRPLKFVTKDLSKEQNDAIDDLLTSLELPDNADNDAVGDSNKYWPGRMPDPCAQNMWDMISFRAFNPDQPLPPVADDVKNLLKQPECVEEKCKPIAEKIKDLFSLEKKEPFKTRRYNRVKDEDNEQSDDKNDIIHSDKEQEEVIRTDNNVTLENKASLANVCNFNFDEIDDV